MSFQNSEFLGFKEGIKPGAIADAVVPDIQETEAGGSLEPRRLSQVLLFGVVAQWESSCLVLSLIPSIAKFKNNNNNVLCEI